ncbi:hypothetical protein BC940DRAFT_331653 [Gongronella butleri]|nr:hypothetical protein BC940DRAFT_331653 [Gongronella butleri]
MPLLRSSFLPHTPRKLKRRSHDSMETIVAAPPPKKRASTPLDSLAHHWHDLVHKNK